MVGQQAVDAGTHRAHEHHHARLGRRPPIQGQLVLALRKQIDQAVFQLGLQARIDDLDQTELDSRCTFSATVAPGSKRVGDGVQRELPVREAENADFVASRVPGSSHRHVNSGIHRATVFRVNASVLARPHSSASFSASRRMWSTLSGRRRR